MIRKTALILSLASLSVACDNDGRGDGASDVTALVQYQSCYELETDLKRMMRDEIQAYYEQMSDGPVAQPDFDTGAVPNAGSESGAGAGPRTPGEDYSTTNNQEAGVDEADFVKTDGFHIYVINGNRLHIFDVPSFGQLLPLSETELEGTPQELLVDAEAKRAVVFSRIYSSTLPEGHPLRASLGRQEDDAFFYRVHMVSKLTVLDLSNLGAPKLLRELYMEGDYQTARLFQGTVRAGVFGQLNIPGMYEYGPETTDVWGRTLRTEDRALRKLRAAALSDLVPRVYERRADGAVTIHALTQNNCQSFYRPENSHGSGVTSLFSLDLFSERLKVDADHIVTNAPTIYASDKAVVVAEPANAGWWYWHNDDVTERLNLHVFDARSDGVSKYIGSGRVKGLLHNQFSLDEHEGTLRVATTENMDNRFWLERRPSTTNHLFVLAKEGQGGRFNTIGHVGGIANNERIFSARLIGDRGYMVTFRQVDPLFTLDLSDAHNPKVVGELEVPGFSTYLHPLDDNRLLSIGRGGTETGASFEAQVSLFDVSDFAMPTLADALGLAGPGGSASSEALYEHKAFQYFAPRGLLAVPVSGSGFNGNQWTYSSRLELITVGDDSLATFGEIDQSDLWDAGIEPYYGSVDIRRSIFMGDYIYAIGDHGITVHSLTAGLPRVAEQPLPGQSPNDGYWWW